MSTRQDKTHYAHNDLEQMNAYVESTAFKDRVRKHEEEEAARKAELLNHVREAEETKWRRGFMSTRELEKSLEGIALSLKARQENIEFHLSCVEKARPIMNTAAERGIAAATTAGELGGLQHGIDLIEDLLWQRGALRRPGQS